MKKHINLLSGLVLAIILVGVISAATVFVSAQTYRQLAIDLQRQYMARLVEVKVAELINEAIEDTRRLGLQILNAESFRVAIDAKDRDAVTSVLEEQFRLATASSSYIEMAGMFAFDSDFALFASVANTAFRAGPGGVYCSGLVDGMRKRRNADRFKPAHELCVVESVPFLAVMEAIGGPEPTGYLQVLVNLLPQLGRAGEQMDMPLQITLMDGSAVFSSPGWQEQGGTAIVRADYILRADDSRPALTITDNHLGSQCRCPGHAAGYNQQPPVARGGLDHPDDCRVRFGTGQVFGFQATQGSEFSAPGQMGRQQAG